MVAWNFVTTHGGANFGGYGAVDRFQCAFNRRQPPLEAGMMKQATFPNDSSFGIEGTTEYGYDATQKRVYKKITRSASIAEHTVYVYAGPNCIAEYPAGTAAASPTQEYVYAQEIDSLVLLVKGGGTDKYTITRNQQWSVTALAELASGTIVERYTYDHFGKRTILEPNGTTVRSSSSYAMPYGYTSRRHDAETDLMYFRARYYDPHTAEFISPDPLEYVDGMSLFRGYFTGSKTDPDGKLTITRHNEPFLKPVQCGDFIKVKWDIELDNEADCGVGKIGFLVQKITTCCKVVFCPCDKNGLHDAIDSDDFNCVTYYESWPIENRQRKPSKEHWPLPHWDAWTAPLPKDTCGMATQIGEVRFYCQDTTGFLGTPGNYDGLWDPGKVYTKGQCNGTPGNVNSTDWEPVWWNRPPIEGSNFRFGAASWTCCKDCEQAEWFAYP